MNRVIEWAESAGSLRKCRKEKVCFFLLNQGDLLLTVFAVSIGFNEVNPWMRHMLQSPTELVIYKVAVPLFISWLVPGKVLWPAIALLVFVVGWDVSQILIHFAG